MAMTVYVAGASADLARARAAMAWVRGQGWQVTHDWVPSIEESVASGVRDADMDVVDQRVHARADLSGVAKARVLWALVPIRGVSTIGMWVEMGYAMGRGVWVVASGLTASHYLFTSLADFRCLDDNQAKAHLLTLANEG